MYEPNAGLHKFVIHQADCSPSVIYDSPPGGALESSYFCCLACNAETRELSSVCHITIQVNGYWLVFALVNHISCESILEIKDMAHTDSVEKGRGSKAQNHLDRTHNNLWPTGSSHSYHRTPSSA